MDGPAWRKEYCRNQEKALSMQSLWMNLFFLRCKILNTIPLFFPFRLCCCYQEVQGLPDHKIDVILGSKWISYFREGDLIMRGPRKHWDGGGEDQTEHLKTRFFLQSHQIEVTLCTLSSVSRWVTEENRISGELGCSFDPNTCIYAMVMETQKTRLPPLAE